MGRKDIFLSTSMWILFCTAVGTHVQHKLPSQQKPSSQPSFHLHVSIKISNKFCLHVHLLRRDFLINPFNFQHYPSAYLKDLPASFLQISRQSIIEQSNSSSAFSAQHFNLPATFNSVNVISRVAALTFYHASQSHTIYRLRRIDSSSLTISNFNLSTVTEQVLISVQLSSSHHSPELLLKPIFSTHSIVKPHF